MNPIMECKGLTKKYGNKIALNSIDLTVSKGKIVGLLGANGSGKTTLIKLASGILTPTSGQLLIDGLQQSVKTKKIISYLPDTTYLETWMKVSRVLSFFSDFYDDFDINKAKEMLQRLNISTSDTLDSMSKGTKEKVQLILVMSRRAELYLLDEPIGGVDPAARDYILDTIITNYSNSSTILISTHLIYDIERILDDVIFINNGNIALVSSVDDIRQKQGKSVDELFREVFRC